MSTKREPVAFDVGEDHRLVRRPVPSVPDKKLGGRGGAASAAGKAMSRMTSPASDQGFQNPRYNSSSHITRPGDGRPPWMAGRPQADSGSADNSSITMDSSLKKEATEDPSTSAWDRLASMSNSLNRHEDSVLAQRKAAFMYGSPLQALSANAARTSALGNEAQLGAHQSSVTLGTEPSSSRSAGTSGSPAPSYTRMKGNSRFENGVQNPLPQQQRHPIQDANVTVGHAPGAGKHPNTAQLTIFYAGMVNVYDDVPYDKAQAIMLLAGTGNAWSPSNYTNFLGSCGANAGRPFSTPGGMNQPMSRAGSPAPQSATPSAGPPSGAVTTRQVTTAVELPQARKASLSRFLEKRKDRVRKGPYTHPNEEAARNDASRRNGRESSPSRPDASSKPPRRSLSPPTAGNETNNGSDQPNSQPQTPPRQSMSEDRSHGILARKEFESSNVDAIVARGAKSSPSR